MTVCIAATALGEYVVTISDRKIGLGVFSADCVADKIDQIHPNWTAMVSAGDITDAIPIWDKVKERLDYSQWTKTVKPSNKTLKEVVQVFVGAFQEYRKEQITSHILADYGLTPERLLTEGKRLLGLSLFTDLWNQIAQFKIDCQFLVAGFDLEKQTHIFGIEDPGICKNYSSLGFWAIGSGQQQALSSIFFSFRDVNSNPAFESIVYDLCAAKFMAEAADGVGEATNVVVHRFGEQPRFYDDTAIKILRDAWEKSGRPRIPVGIEQVVKGLKLHPIELMS